MGKAAFSGDRRRILVVVDVELNRALTEAVLRGAIYDVDSVEDGASALAALDARPDDLVLMDLEMPGLGGHATAAAIRGNRKGNVVKLAALSSHNRNGDRHRSAEVGMAAHIARDPWQRKLYDDWVARLGTERMRGFLLNLRDQLAALADLVADGPRDDLHKLAHDVASTAGMLGFLDVTERCRVVLQTHGEEREAHATLAAALDAAIDRLDRHVASERRNAA